MTNKNFKKWKKNGNLLLKSNNIYQSLLNDLTENIKLSPSNLFELAKYLSLSLIEAENRNQTLKLEVLAFALKFQKYHHNE